MAAENQILWIIGCINMAASLAFSAIGHHKKSLEEDGKKAMMWATSVHQVSAIGFIILACMQQTSMLLLPITMLAVATFLFPGVVYY